MKFVDTIKTDITWLVVQGTAAELDGLIAWTEKHCTMWVMQGKRQDALMVPNDNLPATLSAIRARLLARSTLAIKEQRFGFKAASDALRCKLTLA